MKKRTLLFDLDGTLTDSAPGITRCVAYAMAELGYPCPPKEDLTFCVGPPLSDSFLKLGVPEHLIDEAIRLYRSEYHKSGKWENYPYEGIAALLEKLQEEGYRLYVATSKPESLAKEILEKFELAGYFAEIAGATMDHSRETKSAVIQYLLDQTDADDFCLMIGDTVYDVLGAKELGIPCIGVDWGFGKAEDMLEAGAVSIACTMDELYEQIKKTHAM